MGDDSEWMKLPTEDKVTHKVWKARLAGYEEAAKQFPTLDEKSPEFSKYLGLLKKFVIDNNAIAQEKGLDAVLAFVENAAVAGKTTGEIVNGLVTKCFNASRAKTKERAFEIVMMYIEIEKQEIVMEELMKGLENKQPKIVAASVQAIRDAVRDFGAKCFTLKPVVKMIPKLLEDRDKNVREMTKSLTVELYRWIGAALKPQLANLKPVQITELETEFENLAGEKPVQTRFLRSQADLKAKMEAKAARGGGEEEGEDEDDEEAAEEIDPYELMTAVDILSKLPKDFYEKIEAKKWQERREALDAVHKLLESPKLENGDYRDLVRALRKVVAKDTNVLLVTIAAQCLANLGKGLRKKFQPFAHEVIQTALEKFKEKKVTAVAALREMVDAASDATTLEVVSEDCLTALENKNPQIKAETARFIARWFTKCTPTTLPKKMLKLYCATLCKTINDTTPDVREASFEALGTAMRVVGEKPLTPFLADVDHIKLDKIKECCEKAVLVNMKGGGAKPPSKAVPPAAAPASKASAPPAKAASTSKPAEKAASKPTKKAAGGPPKSAAGKKGAAKKATGGKEGPTEQMLSDEAVEEKGSALLTAELLTNLASSNWKERLAATEKMRDVITGLTRDDIPTQVCVRVLSKKPGLKDTNFQVLGVKLNLVSHLAMNSKFSQTSAQCILGDMVDKVGDVKNGGTCQEALSCIAEATSLEFVAQEVMKLAFAQKNPKNQSEALNWLAKAVKEFGFKINVKPVIEVLKKAFAATNPAVRTSAITFVAVAHMYMGPTLRTLFEDEKPALLQQIDDEIAKVQGEKPPAPTRGTTPKDKGGDDEEEDEEEGEEQADVADLVPRNDISDKITEEIVTEMADKNWKIRNEALQKVAAILNEAKFITPNLGSLPEALKARLGDSNKILVSTCLTICQTLATAIGPKIKQHVRIIGPGMVGCFGDSKPQLRAATGTALDAWVEQCTLLPFLEGEIFSEHLKKGNPNLKTELLGWLATKLPSCKKVPKDNKEELLACISSILTCLEDRNAGVRTKAQEALVPFMIHTGYDAFLKACNSLPASSKEPVKAQLDKARENLPAKPPPKSKSTTSAAPTPVATPPEDDEPEPAPSAPKAAAKSPPKAEGKPKAGGKIVVRGMKKGPAAGKSSKKDVEVDLSPPLTIGSSKEKRMKDEKNLKTLKWNFTSPLPEFVEQLKKDMEQNVNKTLMDQMFNKDFKQHIKALDTLIKAVEEHRDATVANLDLILRWMTLRFFETNPTVHIKALEYLASVFSLLAEEDYHLLEFEAYAFVPYLILKVGDKNENIRRGVRNIFKLICKIYPASKMFSFILDGLKSKNSKQRTECLEELGSLIEVYGINVCQPSPAQALKLIAGQISDRDNSVRSAALNTAVEAYVILGESVFKYIGNLPDKEQAMLEERIKRSNKNRPATAQQPQPVKTSPDRERPQTAPAAAASKAKTQGIPGPRVATPVRRSASGNVKREFALELDDQDEPNKYEMPKLVDVDVDEILNDTVQIPKTRARPPSPLSKLLHRSADANTAIDLVISQITSGDISVCIQSLAQIDGMLKKEDRAELLTNHVDQLLVAITVQLKMAHTKHMGDPNTDSEDVITLCRALLGTLLELFQSKVLSKVASRDVLKELISMMVTILLDRRLEDFSEGPQLMRSVNVMVVKIVEKSNSTNVMSALIKLFHECMASETCSYKFIELVMKCLWKMMRMLPDIINDIDVEVILYDLHAFLKQFPTYTWKDRAEGDTPLRTVKTIMHSLAKMKGNKILSDIGRIENPAESEVVQYLNKVLKHGVGGGTAVAVSNTKNEQNGSSEDSKTPRRESTGKSSKRLSKSTHDTLAEIFKKIGSKENTREGLNDLYDFKQKNPEADLEPFLRKSSQFFQNYIERGLKNIELERQAGEKLPTPSFGSMSSQPEGVQLGASLDTAKGDVNPAMYMERLKILRARCGLDNNSQQSTETVQKPVKSSSEETLASNLPTLSSSGTSTAQPQESGDDNSENKPAAAQVNVADLKKRLDRIKRQAQMDS